MSFTRAHYELYTYHLYDLDRNTTQVDQLFSVEPLIYLYSAVLPLDHLVRNVAFPYTGGPSSCSFGSDLVVIYRVVQVTDYKWEHFLF